MEPEGLGLTEPGGPWEFEFPSPRAMGVRVTNLELQISMVRVDRPYVIYTGRGAPEPPNLELQIGRSGSRGQLEGRGGVGQHAGMVGKGEGVGGGRVGGGSLENRFCSSF